MSSNGDGSDEEEKENGIDNASKANGSKVSTESSNGGSKLSSISSGESTARTNTSAASGGPDNGSKSSSNMATVCQPINVTTADMEKYTFVDFINKKILEESFNAAPFCKLRLPDAFVRKFVIDPELIEENFKRLNVHVASVVSTLEGVYVRKYERGSYKSTEAVASHVRAMSERNNGDWRKLLSRDTMSAINEMSYVENVHYSYMQKVYDMDVRKELPAGWNLNALKSLLTDLLEKKRRQHVPNSNILSEKALEEIQNRQKYLGRKLRNQKNYLEKRKQKCTYNTAKTGKTSGTEIARILADRIKNKKASIKTYEKHLENHNFQVKVLSEEKYINYQVKLETANKMLSQFVRRRDLEDCVRNALNTAKVLFDEGYVSYEVVRDFLDGRRSAHRDIIIKGMRRINKRDVDFWKTVVSSEEKWNEYFGVDERFRIPAREYNVSSESESNSNEMEEE